MERYYVRHVANEMMKRCDIIYQNSHQNSGLWNPFSNDADEAPYLFGLDSHPNDYIVVI